MAVEIKVPEMGESITEATLLNWTKKPGESVKADEILAELETDKVTMEVRAPATGVLKEQKKKLAKPFLFEKSLDSSKKVLRQRLLALHLKLSLLLKLNHK